jgi:hypothetical protein
VTDRLRHPLTGERHLELAESVLDDWATQLAEADRDGEAAEVLRVRSALLGLRCSFLESEKRP